MLFRPLDVPKPSPRPDCKRCLRTTRDTYTRVYDEVWAEGVAALNRNGLPPCETCHGAGVYLITSSGPPSSFACEYCNGTGTKF